MSFHTRLDSLHSKIEEVQALSEYYDEVLEGADSIDVKKEKLKYVRLQILKKMMDVKKSVKSIEISYAPIKPN